MKAKLVEVLCYISACKLFELFETVLLNLHNFESFPRMNAEDEIKGEPWKTKQLYETSEK